MSTDRAHLHRAVRPRAGRWVAYGIAVAWTITFTALAAGYPPYPGLTVVDRVGFLAVGVAGVLLLHRLGSVAVLPDETGLVVRNVVGHRRLDWAEVVQVRYGRDSTWGRLDLSDGTSLDTMGIQAADGAWAARESVRLATLVELHAREGR